MEVDPIRPIRAAIRPLLIDSAIPEIPLGVWGTCFLATYRGQLFVVTAAHLTKWNHSGEVRILVSDRSMHRLPVSAGIGVLADTPSEQVDLIVYPATLVGLSKNEQRRARILNFDSPGLFDWRSGAYSARFLVAGYPRAGTNVDYDAGIVRAAQVLLDGRYVGPIHGNNFTHSVKMKNSLDLDEFSGFSGSPVFSIEQRIGSEPVTRFCGVAVAGSILASTMHFIDAVTLLTLLKTAVGHIQKFDLQLATKIKKAQR
ncbi:hypothetical protein [Variovorax sp. tm]|uniref:hypothetical protein n=1 Tax=Variovorax atrisoli TaxID=3394203 RepID=UPI003A7FE221